MVLTLSPRSFFDLPRQWEIVFGWASPRSQADSDISTKKELQKLYIKKEHWPCPHGVYQCVGTVISPGDMKVVKLFGVKSDMFFPS